MIIKSIDLNNFRNYGLQSIEFDPHINILYGDNAQGKTNVLEAIYVNGTTKSHRSSKDFEMISFDSDEAHLKSVVSKNDIDYRIDMHLKKNRSKGIAINGVSIRKALDLYGIVNMVFFSPEDLGIIKNGPSQRRRFLDMELCQLDKVYANNLLNYNKALDQRNRLLKEIPYNKDLEDTVDIWNMQLATYGDEIIKRRDEFVDRINSVIRSIHLKLSGDKEELSVKYEPSTEGDNLYRELTDNMAKDIRNKMTSVGPHRDDISFNINDVDIRKYGSQGQQRTTALSLKLAEIEIVKIILGDTPILLLDDVLSELDAKRQNCLLDSIHDIQTIITCTGLDEFINNRFGVNRIFKVSNGKVTREN